MNSNSYLAFCTRVKPPRRSAKETSIWCQRFVSTLLMYSFELEHHWRQTSSMLNVSGDPHGLQAGFLQGKKTGVETPNPSCWQSILRLCVCIFPRLSGFFGSIPVLAVLAPAFMRIIIFANACAEGWDIIEKLGLCLELPYRQW